MRSIQILFGVCVMAIAALSQAAAQHQGTASEAKGGAGQQLAARVNGKPITLAELDRTVRMRLKVPAYIPSSDPRLKSAFRSMLESLIHAELVLSEAKRLKVVVNESEAQKEFANIRSRFPNAETFEQALKSQGLTAKSLNQVIRENQLRQALLASKVEGSISVSAADVREAFESNRRRYVTAEAVHARHILIKVPQSADTQQKETARKKAQGILEEARSGKQQFADLARKYSEGPSATNGGDLGYFERGKMVSPFEAAAWGLKPGGLSDLVLTQFGFHIIKVEDHRQEKHRTFDEVAGAVRNGLLEKKRQHRIEAYFGQLRESASIEIYLK